MTAVPRFSVVIPTRERAATLRYALRTCLLQDRDDVEIIVSDNASADDTRDVAHAANDSRVRYVNTGRRLSMSDNFEFGYTQSRGDFLFFLGDDDGLVRDAITDVAAILDDIAVPAVAWRKADYVWPSETIDGVLMLPLGNALSMFEADKVLRQSLWFAKKRLWFPWTRLPVVMTSFVKRSVLEELRQRTGRLFWSSQPDVYSGFAVASAIPRYLYSTRPFSVNGGSRFSNGRSLSAVAQAGMPATIFAEENAKSEAMPRGKLHVRGSVISCVLEAAWYANHFAAPGHLRIRKRAFIDAIADDLRYAPEPIYEQCMKELVNIANEHLGVQASLETLRRENPNLRARNGTAFSYGITRHDVVSFNAKALGLDDIEKACAFTSNVLPKYERPRKLGRYHTASRIFDWLLQKDRAVLAERSLSGGL